LEHGRCTILLELEPWELYSFYGAWALYDFARAGAAGAFYGAWALYDFARDVGIVQIFLGHGRCTILLEPLGAVRFFWSHESLLESLELYDFAGVVRSV